MGWFSIYNRFDESFQGASMDGTYTENDLIAMSYRLFNLVLICLMLMNLIIAILTTAYEEASAEVGKSYWAEREYLMILHDISNQEELFQVGKLARNHEGQRGLWVWFWGKMACCFNNCFYCQTFSVPKTIEFYQTECASLEAKIERIKD